jgi:hypothetical protein
MKKLSTIALGVLSSAVSLAQTNDSSATTKTLLHLPKITHIGFYIAPEIEYGQLSTAFTPFAGHSAMVLFNNKFAIGYTASQSIDRNYSPTSVFPLYVQSNFSGLKLEYILNPKAPVHVSFPLMIGYGQTSAGSLNQLTTNNYNDTLYHTKEHKGGNKNGTHNRNDNMSTSNYFVVQPSVNIEANLFKYIKLFAGVNYRVTIETKAGSTLPSNALNGLAGTIGLKLGLFEINTAFLKKKKK